MTYNRSLRGKTHVEERADRLRDEAATADVWEYQPAGLLDALSREERPARGEHVVKIQPHGCPRNGTMQQAYVADLEGRFLRMVNEASLALIRRGRIRQVRG